MHVDNVCIGTEISDIEKLTIKYSNLINEKTTFIIDIDDTILFYSEDNNGSGIEKYKKGMPNIKEINEINKKYCEGHTIIIHTGRNWDKYSYTVKQLNSIGLKYHQLVMGKPQGIYIDKDSHRSIQSI